MKKGTSFPEIMIVLLVISTALLIFLKIAADYTRSLVFAKEMFALSSILHEKYQFLIAYRNKSLEDSSSLSLYNYFCLDFDTSTSRIILSPSSSCRHKFLNNKDSNLTYIINVVDKGDYYDVEVRASSSKPFGIEANLKGFLIKSLR